MAKWPSAAGGPSWSPGLVDRAETFAESGVSVTHKSTTVNSGMLGLLDQMPGEFNHGLNSSGTTGYTWAGYHITQKVSGSCDITVHVANASGNDTMTAMRVIRRSDGTVVQQDDGISVYGSSYTMTGVPLESGTDYLIEGKSSGQGKEDTNPSFSSDVFDCEAVSGNGSSQVGTSFNQLMYFSSIRVSVTPESGSAVVEWPMPDDVAEWDSLYYQATEDGGTISVYAVDPSTGDRLTGALDDPGDISGVLKAVNVAFEVVLERTSTDQNPQLGAIFRRRKIT